MDNYTNITMEIEEVCGDPSICETPSGEGNVGLAFGLTIGAGLATTIGAMLPFIPFIKRANTAFLSIGLALAAGVMLYVSFTEIWTKSQDNFCCITTKHFDLAVMVCFFGGVIFTVLLDVLVGGLQRLDCGCRKSCCRKVEPGNAVLPRQRKNYKVFFRSKSTQESPVHATNILNCPNGSEQPSGDCNNQQIAGAAPEGGSVSTVSNTTPSEGTSRGNNTASVNELFSNTSLLRMNAIIPETASLSLAGVEEGKLDKAESVQQVNVTLETTSIGRRDSEQVNERNTEALGPMEFKEVTEGLEKDTKKLHRMGLLTALAIGLHNFPEGMATFVAALSSPSLGVALAIAIALHNVPEGLCVAMPVYYATGSRFKGFLWAFLSGVSEPVGALLGWLILKDLFGPMVFGIAFGLIAGMMVFISLKELLPMAYKFDKSNGRLVALFLALGMFIMALSLILFLY